MKNDAPDSVFLFLIIIFCDLIDLVGNHWSILEKLHDALPNV